MQKKLYIGPYLIDPPLVLAPMAGITNLPFRMICKHHGAGLVVTEMVSANGLVRNNPKTYELMKSDPDEHPLCVQIFGESPETMATAAKLAETFGAAIIDINMGCPVKKIVKNGAGAALLKDESRAREIISAVCQAVLIPVTIKMRTGWDNAETCLQLSKDAEALGVAAVTIHARSALQQFSGQADWSVIAQVRKELCIPLIGNGDIKDAHEGIRLMEKSGCAGIMIGRGALGNPWIFSQIASYLKGMAIDNPKIEDIFTIMIEHLIRLKTHFGSKKACRMARTILPWYIKGMNGARRFRHSLNQTQTLSEILELINAYHKEIGEIQR